MFKRSPEYKKAFIIARKNTIRQNIGDVILIVAIITAAVLSIPLVSQRNRNAGAAYAIVEVNGRESLRIALGENQKARTFTVDGFAGSSTIEVENGRVRMLKSDCPDKLCIGMGWADKTGDSIICIPNRVVIRLDGPEKDTDVDTITE